MRDVWCCDAHWLPTSIHTGDTTLSWWISLGPPNGDNTCSRPAHERGRKEPQVFVVPTISHETGMKSAMKQVSQGIINHPSNRWVIPTTRFDGWLSAIKQGWNQPTTLTPSIFKVLGACYQQPLRIWWTITTYWVMDLPFPCLNDTFAVYGWKYYSNHEYRFSNHEYWL